MTRIEVEGRLGMDAELKTWNGTQFISFRVAVSEKKDDETKWYTVTGDYERYKKMYPYLKKGSGVNVFGMYSDGIYTTRENKPMIDRKIKAYDIRFSSIGGQKKEDGGQAVTATQNVQPQPAQPVYQQPVQTMGQPAYQAPQGVQQPIQQPVQPVYQQPAQPVYQQPVQTAAQPAYQAPQGVQQPIQQPVQPVYQAPQATEDDLPF